ncbi:MAG TPA: PEGA domain-containing protein, partial [candidate division Zixibacteria bacterium]|nr:PEGA domain-containing protein [candidate division Zixibacteria bacterium]
MHQVRQLPRRMQARRSQREHNLRFPKRIANRNSGDGMKNFVLVIIAIALATLFIACDGNNPSDDKGTLHVISDPDSASIFIDGTLQTGKYTNTSFELDPGNYTIRVAKSGYDASPADTLIEIIAEA